MAHKVYTTEEDYKRFGRIVKTIKAGGRVYIIWKAESNYLLSSIHNYTVTRYNPRTQTNYKVSDAEILKIPGMTRVTTMGTNEGLRGKGIGGTLHTAMQRDFGKKKMYLLSAPGAIQFHRSHGYRETGLKLFEFPLMVRDPKMRRRKIAISPARRK